MARPRPVPPCRRVNETIGLYKRGEDRLEFVLGDAHAGVGNGHVDTLGAAVRGGGEADRHGDRSWSVNFRALPTRLMTIWRRLAGSVAMVLGVLGSTTVVTGTCFSSARGSRIAHAAADDFGRVGNLDGGIGFPRLDLGEVEDVADQAKELFAAPADDLHVVLLLLGEWLLAEELGETEDAVHGRADLVANVGEERALGLVGRLGGGARPIQVVHHVQRGPPGGIEFSGTLCQIAADLFRPLPHFHKLGHIDDVEQHTVVAAVGVDRLRPQDRVGRAPCGAG